MYTYIEVVRQLVNLRGSGYSSFSTPPKTPTELRTHQKMIKTSWDDDGRLYYYNSATRAAQWNKPRGYQIPIEVNANSPDTSRESYSADFGGWAQVIAKQPWVGYSDREGSPVW